MSYYYTILKYNFYSSKWVVMYSTAEKKLALVKYNQYKHFYPYYQLKLVEECVVDEER